jgi:VanZ family protein
MKKPLKIVLTVLWFLFMTYLFLLPGQAFPSKNWLYELGFDKWVHIGLFFTLLLLCSWTLSLTQKNGYWLLFGSSVLYGFLIEVCQDRLVQNRTFTWDDLLADSVGALAGLWVWYKKNKPL